MAPQLYTLLSFFFNDTATTEIYTLSLHDALPILRRLLAVPHVRRGRAGPVPGGAAGARGRLVPQLRRGPPLGGGGGGGDGEGPDRNPLTPQFLISASSCKKKKTKKSGQHT